MKEYVPLRSDEIDCRVGTATQSGVSLLLYKNARVDRTKMDEMFGPLNWSRKHDVVNGNLFCTVAVRGEDGIWVSKQDVGVESYTEKEKGEASDAFKRACVNWGIGRELYSAPFVWVNLNADEWRQGAGGKKQPAVGFKVSEIEYEQTGDAYNAYKISYLVIVDGKGNERYRFGQSQARERSLQKAIDEAKACDTIEALTTVWNKYAKKGCMFHGDARFTAAVTELGTKMRDAS